MRREFRSAITFALVVAGSGFTYQWLKHSPEKRGFFGSSVWWAMDRPIHAMLFFMAAVTHHLGMVQTAGALIVADVAFSAANRLL
jgi:hypothetical protein